MLGYQIIFRFNFASIDLLAYESDGAFIPSSLVFVLLERQNRFP